MASMQDLIKNISEFDIAVVGLAGRFPGANNIKEYWDNLANGRESITFFSDEELQQTAVDPTFIAAPNYVKAAPVLNDYRSFDARFFDYSPKEAMLMDPQQRVFLECAWHALEHAGYNPFTIEGPVGVFGGTAMNTYFMNSGYHGQFVTDYLSTLIGNDNNFLTTRVSYKLNLKGPSVTVQTACSTSLVAIHHACQSLINEECDMALAGGVSVRVPMELGHFYSEAAVFSPDGHCRPFDATAQGTIFGSGVGMATLKRLKDAVFDGDSIHAVIKGSAVNNDGSRKTDYTAPSVNSQAEVIIEALGSAGVTADTISYIEAHGTGTYLGDPIEVTALSKAFRMDTDRLQFCGIGSVKSNIGHLDAAAGVAGLIKTVLALKHKKIPATINFDKPNPEINFSDSPFYVNHTLRDWQSDGTPRRAGITSLGIGGTNAHVILEEAPALEKIENSGKPRLLIWSAKTRKSLEENTEDLAHYLESSAQNLDDISHTLQEGRAHFDHRSVLVVKDKQQGAELLKNPDPSKVPQKIVKEPAKEVVFLFPGSGSAYPNMAKDIYHEEAVFRDEVDKCLQYLETEMDLSLKPLLFPEPGQLKEAKKEFKRPSIGIPALFAVSYGLGKLWLHWGINPVAMVGHSVGEYLAACFSEVMSWQHALYMVTIRGRLFEQMPPGSMMSLPMTEDEIKPFLTPRLTFAAINSPTSSVVSGPNEDIDELESNLKERGIETRKLLINLAAHSIMIDDILPEYNRALKKIALNQPQIPYTSNVSGTWITKAEATSNQYYLDHLRNAVRFKDNAGELLKQPNRVFIEVGPGRTLTTLLAQHSDKTSSHHICTSLRHPKEEGNDVIFMLNTLAKLYLTGLDLDWSLIRGAKNPLRRIPLPLYNFSKKEYWFSESNLRSVPGSKLLPDQWYYTPSWVRHLSLSNETTLDGNWVVIGEDTVELRTAVKSKYQQEVPLVNFGDQFNQVEEDIFQVNPYEEEGLRKLLETLGEMSYNFLVQISEPEIPGEKYFYLLFNLARTINQIEGQHHLIVISQQGYDITGAGDLQIETSLVTGPVRVINKEFTNIQAIHLDSETPVEINRIEAEITNSLKDPIRVIRGKYTWTRYFDQLVIPDSAPSPIKKGGCYLITGGLSGIGLVLANHLASRYGTKLVLVGRSEVPDSEQWDQIMASNSPLKDRITGLRELEKTGVDILTPQMDVSDPHIVEKVFTNIYENENFGAIDGIIHSAGLIEDSPILLKEKDSIKRVMKAKVDGTQNLLEQLMRRKIPLLVLFSSVNSFLAPAGQIDYSAANAYLDAVSEQQDGKDTRIVTINWPGWKETGIVSRMNQELIQEIATENTILNQEGIRAFEESLKSGSPQVIVYPKELNAEYKRSLEPVVHQSISPVEDDATTSTDHPPRTDMEIKISQTWKKRLGISHLGIYDDYYDLGGNSLIATQIIADINKSTSINISIKDFLSAPTVKAQADIVESRIESSKENANKLTDLLKKVQQEKS